MVEDQPVGRRAFVVLGANTLAFTVCFAVWVMYGVLITWLVDNNVYRFTSAEMGWLIGIPILTGSLFRLPIGVLTDKYGGRPVFLLVMLSAAAAAWFTSYADSFWSFIVGGLGFGMAGASFAVGIAYTSVWFTRKRQGTALGVFGAGNAGAALTSMGAPLLLGALTDGGKHVEGWRDMPRIYAAALVIMSVLFLLVTKNKKPAHGTERTLMQRLQPLKQVRVWRFGLYYFLVFGGFVALAQWLIPYYVNVYTVSVATAGMLAAIFTLPSGLIRAFGGWLSDRFGARAVMRWVLGGCAIGCALLFVPRMDIYAPGRGVMAGASGEVEVVEPSRVVVSGRSYDLRIKPDNAPYDESELIFPTGDFWHEARVAVGDKVAKRELLAKGVTHVYFQANIWIFTAIVFVIGLLMGIGKAAVYKYIPEYFPDDVGVVGGIVGVLGGLGGFVGPILFGELLGTTGIWTTCWMLLFAVALWSLLWMKRAVRQLIAQQAPLVARHIEHHPGDHGPEAT
ncbi:MAG: MFS transporter [Deltaproteobacteria bacterium HGW-Deltaproteobacteria-14]|jgi:NNP family nitrate/nitrite transporter-like MFS transporter|nr:MAG: MFS transporter [Deltaproteobacteria bacterium HGW-Deltaproteobacteria-14]